MLIGFASKTLQCVWEANRITQQIALERHYAALLDPQRTVVQVLCHIRSRKSDVPGDPAWSNAGLHSREWRGSGESSPLIHKKKAKIYSTVPSAIGGTPVKKCAPYRLKAETDNPHYFTLDWIAWGLEINISLEHLAETCPWRVRFYKWQQTCRYLPHFSICCKLKEEVRKNLGATIHLYSKISNIILIYNINVINKYWILRTSAHWEMCVLYVLFWYQLPASLLYYLPPCPKVCRLTHEWNSRGFWRKMIFFFTPESAVS